MSDQFFIMLREGPRSGPNAFLVGQELNLLYGGVIGNDEITQTPRFELRVAPEAEEQDEVRPLDFHYASTGLLLFSEKAVRCLENLGVDNLQYFPTSTTFIRSGEQLNYRLVNIVGVVEGMDAKASDCDTDEEGRVERFRTIALNDKKLAGYNMVRLYERFHFIIISKRVKEAIAKSRLTGFKIVADREWEMDMF